MLDSQTRKKLEEMVKERIKTIRNSDEAYIYVKTSKEKIKSIEVIKMGITERVQIMTFQFLLGCFIFPPYAFLCVAILIFQFLLGCFFFS